MRPTAVRQLALRRPRQLSAPSLGLVFLLNLAALGCAAPAPIHTTASQTSRTVDVPPARVTTSQKALASAAKTTPAKQPAPQLPPEVVVGVPVEIAVDGERPAHVVHAPADVRRAMVYLHGVCGDITKLEDWAEAASHYVTVVGVRGNLSCGGSRQRWGRDIAEIHHLIQETLAAVSQARGGLLDTQEVVLFGYSQGAARAQRLAAHAPESYPWVILGGAPTEPRPFFLRHSQRVAIIGGTNEPTAHMRRGFEALKKNGIPAWFELIRGTHHGQFGKRASAVVDRALLWLLELEPPPLDDAHAEVR